MATSQSRFICVSIFKLDGCVTWAMCGVKSTTLYLCVYLLISGLCSVGHVWRQVIHVLFVFLSYN